MNEVKEKLKKIIEELFAVPVSPEVVEAPEETGADFASNVAFSLAREVHRSPREIAEEIKENFRFEGYKCEVAGGGFLNFISPDEYFFEKIEEFSDFEGKFKENISLDEYSGKTVVCEFSDPNPFKVLHVGHLYTSIVGDAISRLVENAGGKVVRANFGGDVGLHVAKTIFILKDKNCEELTIEKIAEAYVEGTRAYEEDSEAKEKITALNKEIYRINKENVREGEVAEIYWKGRELSYQYFRDFYESIGVKFDKYYPESTVAGIGLEKVRENTPEVYKESNGAIVFPGEEYGLHTRVFVNKEGLPTYEAKDVGLIFAKDRDFHFDKSIVITGNDIIDYMKVVLKSIEQYAPELVERTKHITHGNVRLPGNEKMSSRKGNFIKAIDILQKVNAFASAEMPFGKQRALGPSLRARAASYSAVASVCSQKPFLPPAKTVNCKYSSVALAAIKYGFLRYKIGNNIEFDIKECVSTTGNSGPYILYSAVRAKKIIEKCQGTEGGSRDYELNQFERKVCKKIVQYPEIVKQATKEFAPHVICNYLFEISQEFSRFYENVKVAGSEEESFRKKIVQAYKNVLESGLDLVGIKIPEEM